MFWFHVAHSGRPFAASLEDGWPFILIAFLIGSIPFGIFVSRVFFKTDIRAAGSGNIGAANALRTMGRGAGLAVLVLDALKGAVATLFPYASMAHEWLPLWAYNGAWYASLQDAYHTSLPTYPIPLCGLCGLAAMFGHCYSPWLKFKGGKGVATYLGVLIVAWWPSAVVFGIVWFAIVRPTGYASAGSMLGALAAGIALIFPYGGASVYFTIPAAALIVWKHRENIARLLAGNENRLSLSKRAASAP